MSKSFGYGFGFPMRNASGAAPFSPTDISGLILWLKADAGVTLVSGQVDVWADQSGNLNNAIAPSSLRRPDYTANFRNGKPSIYKSLGTTGIGLELTNEISFSDFTFFIVRKKLPGRDRSIYMNGATVNAYIGTNVDGYGCDSLARTPDLFRNSYSNNFPCVGNETNLGVFCGIRSGTSAYSFLNGAKSSISTGLATNLLYLKYLMFYGSGGNSQYDWSGDICEIIWYNSALSDANVAKVNAYLNKKYLVY